VRTLAISLAPLGAAILLAGCEAVGPNFLRPAAIVSPEYKEIAGWKVASPRANEPKGAWWTVFRDPGLDRLEEAVAISNQTIKADEANYRQALALINEARSGLYPSVAGAGSAERGSSAGTILTAEASGQWMLDIWGQIRREIESQQAGAETAAANLANARLAAQSALALAYFTMREADSLEDLLRQTVEQYKRSLEIAQNQYDAGTAAKSDVITAQAQVLNAQSQLIAAGVSRAQSEHAIAVLMGRPPAGLSVPPGALPASIPRIPVNLPSELLERRPDIASAEEAMRQANAEIGVAFAGYFPQISLSGLFGYSGNPAVASLSNNPVWSFGSSLAQPLFNGGSTGAQVEAAREIYNASVATYRQTVLTAIQQVEDNLAAIRIYSRQTKVQTENVRISRQATQIALNEYRAGTQAFTTVVTNEAQQLLAEESELATRAQLHFAAVNLIAALGGGWNVAKLPDAAAESKTTGAVPPSD